jgi:hypothetical protein
VANDPTEAAREELRKARMAEASKDVFEREKVTKQEADSAEETLRDLRQKLGLPEAEV